MSNVAKLKKRALEYEQKKQFDKALETYAQILEGLDEHVDEADVALYNRVGDLLVRRGDVMAAVDHYEKAVDLYTDGGFFNNAIALCNKILRNAPGRNSIYYKLGKISAKKGFVNDAKQNFLEYADRMQRAGELEEAFRALKEFADLCPDQDDIRLMLADQLVRKDRKSEAIEQLQVLYEKFQSEGRTREARATVDRMKALDPELEPKAGVGRPTPKVNDLVFLDVNFDDAPKPAAPAQRPAVPVAPPPAARAAPPAQPPATPPHAPSRGADLPFIDVDAELPPIEHSDAGAGLTPPSSDAVDDVQEPPPTDLVSHVDAGIITGFEQTVFDEAAPENDAVSPLDGLEPTFTGGGLTDDAIEPIEVDDPLADLAPERAADAGENVDLPDADAEDATDLPMLDGTTDEPAADEPEPPSLGGELTFILPDATVPELPADMDALDIDAGIPTAEADDTTLPEEPELPPLARPDPFAGTDLDFDASLDAALSGENTNGTGDPLASLPLLDPAPLPPSHHDRRETAISSLPPLPPDDEPHLAVHHPAAVAAVDRLRAAVAFSPDDFDVRRQLAEALLEEGERDLGLAELEHAMLGFETTGDLRNASAIAEEMIRVEPTGVRYHQKRVEYAVRANDKARLVDAYLSLAECLFGAGQLDKSRAVYGRVIELNPHDERARAALSTVGDETLTPTPPRVTPAPAMDRVRRPAVQPPNEPPAEPVPAGAPDDSFVNLADWLREDDAVKNTRMVVDVGDAQDQEQVDFAEMLSMFKQGVAANVDETDHESHYDLGVAYKEMGLLDEAISEFQKALRGAVHRVRTYEALGQCFVEKRQYQIALTILGRALGDQGASDDQLVGVLYLLGYACEALGRFPDALRYYERVFAVDIQFRDIADRLAAVERRAR